MLILVGICSPLSLITLAFTEGRWVHPQPQLAGKQEMCSEPWFPLVLQPTSLTPDPSPSSLTSQGSPACHLSCNLS